MFRKACMTLLVVCLAAPLAFAAQDEKQEEKKGPLGELKEKVIQIERTHRKNVAQIQDKLQAARAEKDEKQIAALQADLQKERERFREEASDLQKKIRARIKGDEKLDEVFREKKKLAKQIDKELRKLRADLSKARKKGDDEEAAKIRKRIDKVEDEFVERLKKLLDRLDASANDG